MQSVWHTIKEGLRPMEHPCVGRADKTLLDVISDWLEVNPCARRAVS